MEEVVAFFARNLEADDAEPEPFSMHNGLPAFTAAQERCKSHESPPRLGCDSLQVVSERFEIFVCFMQARADLADQRGTQPSRRLRRLFRFRALSEISG